MQEETRQSGSADQEDALSTVYTAERGGVLQKDTPPSLHVSIPGVDDPFSGRCSCGDLVGLSVYAVQPSALAAWVYLRRWK